MDRSTQDPTPPDQHALGHGETPAAARIVAFPSDVGIHEEKATNQLRPRGVEMSRSMTQEARDLAAAGYEHLETEKAKPGATAVGLTHVDIQEHHLPFSGVLDALQTSFDTKDAAQSVGLTSQEALNRLKRDGHNILTPPRKKSAARKVCPPIIHDPAASDKDRIHSFSIAY